ncbi:ATP-binding protein [Streptomyces sp. CB00455]|uniref:ATP-binding protein n=1 Tax=Streptomyces sp. CB00455 TaxID=1703927 RepID=UPI00093E9C92|nr:ATP-binding protein [Streptomyces sp. CB00455]OKK22074.1 ATP-binding protein [Streptomyces sp. CB00455]
MAVRAVGWAKSFPVHRGVREARGWCQEHLDTLSWTQDAPDTVYSVLLTVSELVTNAHVHAHSSAQLVLTWDGQCLHVSVADTDPALPAPRQASDAATSGRGLALIDALADRWDAHAFHGGKTVTACFHPPGQPSPHARAEGDTGHHRDG